MKRIVAALALSALLPGQALAAAPCLNQEEAEAVTATALPDILRDTGQICAASLPATSPLRRADSPLIARYQAEADRAWPAARGALIKLSDPAIAPLLQSDFARPLLASLLVPLLIGKIEADDCPAIDRAVTLLAPLPPRNTAGLVVTALRYLKSEAAKKKGVVDTPDLPICPEGK